MTPVKKITDQCPGHEVTPAVSTEAWTLGGEKYFFRSSAAQKQLLAVLKYPDTPTF